MRADPSVVSLPQDHKRKKNIVSLSEVGDYDTVDFACSPGSLGSTVMLKLKRPSLLPRMGDS